MDADDSDVSSTSDLGSMASAEGSPHAGSAHYSSSLGLDLGNFTSLSSLIQDDAEIKGKPNLFLCFQLVCLHACVCEEERMESNKNFIYSFCSGRGWSGLI